MSTEIKFSGITEFSEKIQTAIKKYPFKVDEELKTLGNDLKRSAKDKTPSSKQENKYKLKKCYKLSPVSYNKSGSSYITLTNTSPHFHLIEKGHRQMDKKGNIVGKGFVPGIHMLENSVTELNTEMQDKLELWADKVLEDI